MDFENNFMINQNGQGSQQFDVDYNKELNDFDAQLQDIEQFRRITYTAQPASSHSLIARHVEQMKNGQLEIIDETLNDSIIRKQDQINEIKQFNQKADYAS
jgi:hypothetical protein